MKQIPEITFNRQPLSDETKEMLKLINDGNISATVVAMLINKQYNSHIKILIDDIEELN